ncbi:uncharacterized protein LOC124943454 [Impatiens glandulifera]|uniref:uncharacterized protein LOC124943454 n=1 Tax=Impatiens glandulifera TaxID=253017 RepID=UPI001FB14558|nr:uncharacterized protein LOC124943454 [Impatiens glandulifera]
MHVPDKEWMNLGRQHRHLPEYIKGVDSFLDFAESSGRKTDIACPCIKCGNRNYVERAIVRRHLIVHGMREDYKFWGCHGEKRPRNDNICVEGYIGGENDNDVEDVNDFDHNDLEDHSDVQVDDLGDNDIQVDNDEDDDVCMENILSDLLYPHCGGSNNFYKVLNDLNEPLYKGSKISKASTLLKLLHLKNVGQWTNTLFDMLLKLLKEEILPENSNLPDSFYESKKFHRNIGLSYEKIDTCKYSCMLFWKDDKDLECCKVCGYSRWKIDESTLAPRKKVNGKNIPNKVLLYFPLTPRLQRLYMCSKTAPSMRWHKDTRVDDEVLRHPADSIT